MFSVEIFENQLKTLHFCTKLVNSSNRFFLKILSDEFGGRHCILKENRGVKDYMCYLKKKITVYRYFVQKFTLSKKRRDCSDLPVRSHSSIISLCIIFLSLYL